MFPRIAWEREAKCAVELVVPLAVFLWLAVTLMGFWGFHAYSSAPGRTGTVPERILNGPFDQSTKNRSRLILFAHPRCPCTRATLTEMALLLESKGDAVAAEVQFIRPRGMPEGWEQTSLWRAAAAIPGVRVSCDEEGVLARRLGAQTSGQVLLYGPEGQLLFSGGITRARGQDGDSAGRGAIVALLAGEAAPSETPVFGCALFSPEECCRKEDDSCRP